MKKIYTPLFILLLISCKESGVQISKPSTFVRYFNGGYQDQAEAIIETSDKGFLILVNSLTCKTLGCTSPYRIKLIKTDAYGNQQWQRLYPEIGTSPTDIIPNYQGFGLAAIQDVSGNDTGYVIAGQDMYDTLGNSKSALLMIQTGIDGHAVNSTPKRYHNLSIEAKGTGVTVSSATGDFFVVGYNLSDATNDMFVTRLEKATLAPLWLNTKGSGGDKIVQRIFIDEQNSITYWGGTWQSSKMQLIIAPFNSQANISNPLNPAGTVSFNLSGSDICKFNNGFAIVGNYNLPGASQPYSRIAFARMDYSGALHSRDSSGITLYDSVTYRLPKTQTVEPANSICSTYDGGLLLLGTISGQGTDYNYYLIKINQDGKKLWAKEYGGSFPDTGSKVLQASDGGYVVLGTTILANVSNVFLMKTDSQGNVQ